MSTIAYNVQYFNKAAGAGNNPLGSIRVEVTDDVKRHIEKEYNGMYKSYFAKVVEAMLGSQTLYRSHTEEQFMCFALNPITGVFTGSDNLKNSFVENHGEEYYNEGWKLIRYECVNDPNFEFQHTMKLR